MEPYEPSEDDRALRDQLVEWRWKMSNNLFGDTFDRGFGYFMFMPNGVLDRICDAAHYNLITSVETLMRESCWDLSLEYGQKVVDMISEIRPVPVPAPAPPPPPPQTPAIVTRKKKYRELTCASCKQQGHSRRAKRCPNYGSYVADRIKNGNEKTPRLTPDHSQVLFVVQRPGDSGPWPPNPAGKFGRMRMIQKVTNA